MKQTFSLKGDCQLELHSVVAERQVRNGVYAVYAVKDEATRNGVHVEVRVGDLITDVPSLKTAMLYGELEGAYPNHEIFISNARFEIGDVYKPSVEKPE